MRRNLIGVLAAGAVTIAVIFACLGTTTEATPETVHVTATAPSTTTTTTDPGPSEADLEQVWVALTNQRILNEAIWIDTTNRALWIARTNERLAAERAKAARRDAADAAAERRAAPPDTPAAESTGSNGRCGGDLPPCYVMMRESGGNIRARNPSSSASGKWQFIDSTWAGFGGYAQAWLAPESVQDAKARQLWAGGAGCGHWNAC